MSRAWIAGAGEAARYGIPSSHAGLRFNYGAVGQNAAGGQVALKAGADFPSVHLEDEQFSATGKFWTGSLCGVAAAVIAATPGRRGKKWQRAAKIVRNDSPTTTEVNVEGISKVLKGMEQDVPSLQRYLADDTKLGDDFGGMEPLVDGVCKIDPMSNYSKTTAAGELGLFRSTGKLIGLEYMRRGTDSGDGNTVTVCICNTEAGLAFGVGVSGEGWKRAKQLSAWQVLDRIFYPENVAQELYEAATEKDAARLVAETLEAMGAHLSDISMTVVQPCGTTWKATLSCRCQGRHVFGTVQASRPTRKEAVAAAGEAFQQQLRSLLRIPQDAPHEPAAWAEALDYSMYKIDLSLGPLGAKDSDVEEQLAEILGDEAAHKELQEALEAAKERQSKRMLAMEEMASTPEGTGEEGGAKLVAHRVFEVTKPEDEDWRREEIKGKLPAEQIREDVSKALEYKQTAIVSGGTGSGKSTQLPQFILDDFREWKIEGDLDETIELEVGGKVEVEYEETWYLCEILDVAEDKKTIQVRYFDGGDEEEDVEVKERCRKARPAWATKVPHIVVTQPRRIAATSLAQRVAWERYGECGGEIGYATRGDTVMPQSDTGTIEYCTVGTLLRRVVTDPYLMRYNVVILDEVHERDLMTDFLLNLLREVVVRRPDLRLVLMSATLDVQTFINYLPGCAVIEVPVGTRYPVEEIHLDDQYFEAFPQTSALLANESTAREAMGAEGGREHDYRISASKGGQDLAAQVSNLIKADTETEKSWKDFVKTTSVSSKLPKKHSEEALRVFMQMVEEGGDEDAPEMSNAALAEQINQLTGYSEEARQALRDIKGQREDESDKLENWETQELLDFLAQQGVRPWKAGKASWEVISSMNWWGNDRNDVSLLELVEELIMKVAPDMLSTSATDEDEFGVGAVLCFLPGWAEIKRVAEKLEKRVDADNLYVLRLHSSVTREEQALIFEPAPEGQAKVILATNIAESSVTINDVRVVIDAGLHRELTYDPKRRMSTLETVWICQSNAVQRKGRAGRVREGRVYRLYSRDQFEAVPWRPAPEMQRCNLASACLQTVSLGRDPREFLAGSPDPPTVAAVEAAMAELSGIEAIQDGVPPRMLPIGQVLCRMPLEPLLGRAMMLGALFGVPQLTAALLVTSAGRSPFLSPPDRRKESLEIKKDYCGYSDSIAALRALKEFEWVYQEKGEREARLWASHYMLNYQRLISFSRVRYQLLLDVQRSGLLTAAAMEGLNPDEWGWEEEEEGEWNEDEEGEEGEEKEEEEEEEKEEKGAAAASEAFKDSAGAIFESDDATSGLAFRDWMKELHSREREVEDERLLVGLLCAAYPTNVAMREKFFQKRHKTASSGKAFIDRGSVNAASFDSDQNRGGDEAAEDAENAEGAAEEAVEQASDAEDGGEEAEEPKSMYIPNPSWWLYSDLRLYNGRLTLQDTTFLSEWHVALFGGLRERFNPSLELDGWIAITAEDERRAKLVERLRLEIRQALVWIAISASWDTIAQAAVRRAKALLSILGSAIMRADLREEDLQVLKEFELPKLEEGESAVSATEEQREEVEEMLWKKTVVELKVMLRELESQVTGRKADLIERVANALIYGPEEEGGEAVEEFREEMEEMAETEDA